MGQAKRAPGPRGHFLIGNLIAFRRDALGLLMDGRRRFGDVVRFRLGPYLVHLLAHPDHVRQVLVARHDHYDKASFSTSKLSGITGESLLTTSGEPWLRLRRLIQPVFQPHRLGGFTGLIVEAVDGMLRRWKEQAVKGEPVDVASEMARLTFAVVGKALFGADVTGDVERTERAVTTVMRHSWARMERLIDLPLWVPTPGNLRFRRALRRLDEIVHRIIAERKQGENGGDLISRLLAARDEETSEGMSPAQLRNEVITLLLAGHETTANALTWTWCLLSRFPAVRERVREEVVGVLGDRPPAFEDLAKLRYTTRVFQEAMRLYPPIWVIERRVVSDDEADGYRLQAGSSVVLSPAVTHRHPAFWDNPEGFDPDRFLPERVAGRHHYAYFPFGGGQRLCVGMHLAMMEGQVVLSRVLQSARLDLVPGFPVDPEAGLTLRAKHGMPMTVRPV